MQKEKLQHLLDCWKEETKDSFHYDGFINYEKYKTAKQRILFVFKEPNKPEKCVCSQTCWYNEFIEKNENGSSKMREKVARMAYDLLYVSADEDDIHALSKPKDEEIKIALEQVAVMNIKKSGGGKTCDMEELRKYYSEWNDKILEEIRIIAPDLIIWCAGIPIKSEIMALCKNILKVYHPDSARYLRNYKFCCHREDGREHQGVEEYEVQYELYCKNRNLLCSDLKNDRGIFKYMCRFREERRANTYVEV